MWLAREGGGDPGFNPTLATAVEKAKAASMPNDNIDRAVKRGSGAEAGAAAYESLVYEGYAPGGVALYIECLTDNKNRAVMEVRTALSRNGGTMADSGSVAYLFERKGHVVVPKEQEAGETSEDALLEIVLEAGAEEIDDLGDSFEIISEAADVVAVRTALQEAGMDYDTAEVTFVPSMEVPLDADGANKVMRVVDALEDCDDVQNVYSNAHISDEVLAELDDED